ncbi:MAG: hypothetical protein ACT4PZ_10320 [Panacagrimonas sp.]
MKHETPQTRFAQLASLLCLAPIAALGLILMACSGGSDSDNDDNSGTDPKTLLMRGFSAKGVVRNADVQLFEYSASSFTNPALMARGVTDAAGAYSISVLSPGDYQGGAILVRISGKPAGTTPPTEARCDVDLPGTDDDCGLGASFGEFYAVDDSFVLESSLSGLVDTGDNTTDINTTVFTNLVTDRAAALLNDGATPASAIRAALSQVNQLAGGLDVVGTRPVDLADATAVAAASPESVVYSALNSGLLRIAAQDASVSNARQNTRDAIDRLNALFGPAATITDVDLQAIADAGRAQLSVAGVNDTTGTLAVIDAFVAQPGDSVSFDDDQPEPEPEPDAVAAAKDFVRDVRTVFQTYETALDPDDNAFANQLSTVRAVSGEATDKLLLDLVPVVDCSAAVVNRDLGGTLELPADCLADGANRFGVADVDLIRTTSGSSTVFTATGTSGTSSVNVTISYPTEGRDATGSELSAEISGDVQTTGTVGVSLRLDSASVEVSLSDPSQPVGTGDNGSNVDRVNLIVEFASVRQKGVANPLAATGDLEAVIVRCARADCAPTAERNAQIFVDTLSFGGAFGNAQGDSFAAGVDLDVRNPRNFNPDSDSVAYSSGNFVDGTVTLSLEAAIPDRPEAELILTVDSTGYDQASLQPIGTVTFSLLENGQLTLRAQSVSTAALPGFDNRVEFTNSAGAVLRLTNIGGPGDGDDIVGTLTFDGEEAATISDDGDVILIRYADGTFETLFN